MNFLMDTRTSSSSQTSRKRYSVRVGFRVRIAVAVRIMVQFDCPRLWNADFDPCKVAIYGLVYIYLAVKHELEHQNPLGKF